MRPRRIKIPSDGSIIRDRGRRLLAHPLAIVAMVAVAGYIGAAVLLNVLVDTEQVRGWIAPRASAVLNRPVSTGEARVALLPRPSIHVADVRVDNLDDFDGPALAFIERVRLDVRWLPLLIGRVSVHRLQLDRPRVYLGIDEGGTSNFGDLIPSGPDTNEALQAPVALGVEQLAVSDASVSYFNAPAARSFTISGADAHVSLAPDGAIGWRADVSAESDSLLARVAAVTEEIVHLRGPRATLTAHSDGAGRTIEIDDGSLDLSGETLALRGRITGLADARPSYDLQLTNDSLDAEVLAAMLPASVRSARMPVMDGRLGVTLQVTRARSSGRPPLVRGSLHLTDVALHLNGQTFVRDVNGAVGVTPDTVLLDSLTGSFADGPFELSGTIARDSGVLALHTRALPDLDALDRLGLVPGDATLSGDADLDLTLAGRLDALDSLDVAGLITLEGLQAKHARVGVPLYVPAGEVALANGGVTWTDLPVLLGQDEVVTTGRLDGLFGSRTDAETVPELTMSVQGSRADLGLVFPARDGAAQVTYGQLAFAHLGDRNIDGRPASAVAAGMGLSRPTRLPVHGVVSLELDTLDFRRYHLQAVSARVELTDTILVVEAPSFEAWGGTSAASLRLGVGEGAGQPFSLSLSSEGGSAQALLATLTPIAEGIEGTLGLGVVAEGAVDRELLPLGEELTGHARLVIADGRLYGTGPNLVVADFLGSPEWRDVPFETWDTELDIVDGSLEVRSSELAGDVARVAFRGLMQMDGTHDLSMGLSIPADRLDGVSLRRTGVGQSVLEQLSASGSSLDLGLRMSGDLAAPQLEPDASNAVALAR